MSSKTRNIGGQQSPGNYRGGFSGQGVRACVKKSVIKKKIVFPYKCQDCGIIFNSVPYVLNKECKYCGSTNLKIVDSVFRKKAKLSPWHNRVV